MTTQPLESQLHAYGASLTEQATRGPLVDGPPAHRPRRAAQPTGPDITPRLDAYPVEPPTERAHNSSSRRRSRVLAAVVALVVLAGVSVAILVTRRSPEATVATNLETLVVPVGGGQVCNADQLCVDARPTPTGFEFDVSYLGATLHKGASLCEIDSISAGGFSGQKGGPGTWMGLVPGSAPAVTLPDSAITQYMVALPTGQTFQVFASQSSRDITDQIQHLLLTSAPGSGDTTAAC